jgi:hypothetical protein
MPKYAYVNGTTVVKVYDSLPTSWNNISNFNLLENNIYELNKYDWYVVQENVPEYDNKKFKLSDPTYEVLGNTVTANYSLITIQPDSPAELQRRFMILVRSKRDQLLRETDWTMMSDVTKTKTSEWVTAWENYRQALRDYPSQFQYEVDDTPVDFKILIWPELPNL